MSENAHRVRIGVQNITDGNTAAAIATDWLRDELPELDIAQVNTDEGVGETTVEFILRLSDDHIEQVKESTFTYLGEVQ